MTGYPPTRVGRLWYRSDFCGRIVILAQTRIRKWCFNNDTGCHNGLFTILCHVVYAILE